MTFLYIKSLVTTSLSNLSLHTFLLDINECDEENGNCSQFCNNTIGSYQCYCEDGYTLDSDEHTCNGMYIL